MIAVAGLPPGMKVRNMVTMFQNCSRILADPSKAPMHERARMLIAAINSEWLERRLNRVQLGDRFTWPSTDARSGQFVEFRIADTFTSSLNRLPSQDQKAVKVTVVDIMSDPSAPGLHLHRVEKSIDKNFWTTRVNDDIRIVLHRTQASLLLCYVDHHDDAYRWAERRRIETHPRTGAAQMVEVVQRQEQFLFSPPASAKPQSEPQPVGPLPLFGQQAGATAGLRRPTRLDRGRAGRR